MLNLRLSRPKALLLEVGVVFLLVLATVFGVPPLLTAAGQAYRINLLGRFLALAIAALGVDLIWGFTGLLSLGQGIFFALGGYSLAMHLQLQIPTGQLPDFFSLYGVSQLPWFWYPYYSFGFTLAAVVLLPALTAALLGYLVFRNRIRGVYFAILTQAALIVFFNFFNGQQKLINGTNGLKTDTTELFGQLVSSQPIQSAFYTCTVVLVAVAYFLCRWLTSGRFGRILVAVRDDETRLRFSGYNPTGFKVVVFAIAAALVGVAGALYTVQSGIITPDAMSIAFSIDMVIWVAVGGRGTLVGAILGALLVEFARNNLSDQFPEFWLFLQGALFLLVVTVLPGGVIGWVRTWRIFPPPTVTTYPSLEVDLEPEDDQQDSRD